MKKFITAATLFLMAGILASPALAEKKEVKTGEQLFSENCTPCHPDGGNIVNPKKTLKKADREANGVKTAADIVKKMRNPGPGMTKFDKSAISDKDAKRIGDYILKTFK